MGKKMGINTKSVEARERKEAQKRAKNDAAEKAREDSLWKDDDKYVNRKLERQKERELKLQQERDRKAANKAAYENDMEVAEKSAKAARANSKQAQVAAAAELKVTRHDIQKNLDDQLKDAQPTRDKKVNVNPVPLVANLNHLDDCENASTIDQALDLLKSTSISGTGIGRTPNASTSRKKK